MRESAGTNQETRETERASVSLDEGMHFVGDADGHRVDVDAADSEGGKDLGARPMRLLLLGLAGCTAIDVISILRKQRQPVSGLRVEASGNRASEHPRVYENIELVYRVQGEGVNPSAVERAIELSETRYCSATAMLGAVAEITSRYEIEAKKR